MRLVLAALTLATLTACGTSEPSKNCIPLSKTAIASINEGATTRARLIEGQAVDLPGEPPLPAFTYIVAGTVKDGTSTEQVFLTVDDTDNPNGIMAADNVAKLYFEWGAAATKGSPAYNAAQDAWLSDQANEARGCLK